MKKIIVGMIALSLLAACQYKTEKKATSEVEVSKLQELYKNETNELSIYKNNTIRKNDTAYNNDTFELIEKEKNSSKVVKGNVNYERGFEDDEDATVYVLNFDKPSEERYFVRFSDNDSTIFLLDKNKKSATLYRAQ